MTDNSLEVSDLIQVLQERIAAGPSPTGLQFNPFPVTGISAPGEVRVLSPVDPMLVDRVKEFLLTALQANQFTGMVVVGDFGFGKTHLLRWIEYLINGAGAEMPNNSVRAYYVSNPGIRPMEILMAVIRAIGEEEFRKMIWSVVASDLRTKYRRAGLPSILTAFKVDQGSLLAPSEESLKALVNDDSLASLGIFRERYRATSLLSPPLRDYVASVLTTVSDNLDVVRALTSVLLDDEMTAFTSWISLSSSEAGKPLRIPQHDYFRAILRVLKENGLGRIFLLIDEFEDVIGMRLSVRQRAEYLATLRLLIDEHVHDFSLVVAMVPVAWEETKRLHPPVAERVAGGDRPVDLLPLDRTRAQELVRRYLQQARTPKNGSPHDSIAPFTSDAIAAMLQASSGNTRAFVSACYRVLQHSWKEASIDGNAARAVINS